MSLLHAVKFEQSEGLDKLRLHAVVSCRHVGPVGPAQVMEQY